MISKYKFIKFLNMKYSYEDNICFTYYDFKY